MRRSSRLISSSSKPDSARSRPVRGLEVSEQPCEELLVPLAADAVQGQVQEVGLPGAEVQEDGGHRLVAEPPGGDEALAAARHDVVLVPGDDGLHEAELAERAGERIELLGADLARVGEVGVQVVDRNVDDLQIGGR